MSACDSPSVHAVMQCNKWKGVLLSLLRTMWTECAEYLLAAVARRFPHLVQQACIVSFASRGM